MKQMQKLLIGTALCIATLAHAQIDLQITNPALAPAPARVRIFTGTRSVDEVTAMEPVVTVHSIHPGSITTVEVPQVESPAHTLLITYGDVYPEQILHVNISAQEHAPITLTPPAGLPAVAPAVARTYPPVPTAAPLTRPRPVMPTRPIPGADEPVAPSAMTDEALEAAVQHLAALRIRMILGPWLVLINEPQNRALLAERQRRRALLVLPPPSGMTDDQLAADLEIAEMISEDLRSDRDRALSDEQATRAHRIYAAQLASLSYDEVDDLTMSDISNRTYRLAAYREWAIRQGDYPAPAAQPTPAPAPAPAPVASAAAAPTEPADIDVTTANPNSMNLEQLQEALKDAELFMNTDKFDSGRWYALKDRIAHEGLFIQIDELQRKHYEFGLSDAEHNKLIDLLQQYLQRSIGSDQDKSTVAQLLADTKAWEKEFMLATPSTLAQLARTLTKQIDAAQAAGDFVTRSALEKRINRVYGVIEQRRKEGIDMDKHLDEAYKN